MHLLLSGAVAMPAEVDVKRIAEDATQAAFAVIAEGFADAGYPVTGDIAPHEAAQIQDAFRLFVCTMAINNPSIAELNPDA